MAFPICDMCASSGVLCSGCERKLKSGEISQLDVILSNVLAREGIGHYDRLKETDNGVLVFADRKIVPKLIGYSGKTVKELSKKLGKKVVIIESDANLREMLEAALKPSRVVAVNTIYKADGGECLRLVLDRPFHDRGCLNLLRELTGKTVEICDTDIA